MMIHAGSGEFGGLAFVRRTNGQVVWQGVDTWESTVGGVKDAWQKTVGEVVRVVDNFLSTRDVSYDDNLGSSLERWKEEETITLYYDPRNSIRQFSTGLEIDVNDPVMREFLKITITRKRYFNESEPQTAELWQKARRGDEQALKELFGMFVQSVTENEDAADKVQRAINRIMADAEQGRFGMGISGERAKELLNILRGGNTAENNKKFEEFVKKVVQNENDGEKQKKVKAYLNGLKFMYDNRDTAAVHIMSKSCAIIADYLLAGLTGRLDPTKVSYEEFYKTKFEMGEIGDERSYTMAPVWNRTFGWGNNRPMVAGLNYRENIEGQNIFAYMRPDLYGRDKDIRIEYQGITAEELEKVKGNKVYEKLVEKIGEFPKNLEDLYNSLSTVEWYIVQRKTDYDDTHFFIMRRVGNEYRLYDHNWLFSQYGWGSRYDRDLHYISRYLWYR
ncbi:MAG: hypothetical protein HPY78_10635 [Brevinematales bacterium]|nr:hypothetical protein [Brevinematales bacterium]